MVTKVNQSVQRPEQNHRGGVARYRYSNGGVNRSELLQEQREDLQQHKLINGVLGLDPTFNFSNGTLPVQAKPLTGSPGTAINLLYSWSSSLMNFEASTPFPFTFGKTLRLESSESDKTRHLAAVLLHSQHRCRFEVRHDGDGG
ncbi:unnamed protein product [Cyprideis torosa]|uniref:Uncharacterized protein n=1 Tax=Cyprideis torosa TaxID=163714 RepID=A0A7R8W3L7_9CRUS|nr:unnamed protein product [Cyprideis torosa]CAG0883130.1 unnamed protein product [Cyprideis torosa]